MKEVTIIGGGIIGLCSAYYLQKDGYKITVIERRREFEHTMQMSNSQKNNYCWMHDIICDILRPGSNGEPRSETCNLRDSPILHE